MSIQTLSSTIISNSKQESINAQSLRRTLPFRDITMIDEKTIEYKGTRIPITKQAFKSLLSLVGMSQSFADKFSKLFNPETKAQFINTMKNAMASNSGKLSNVTLVLNPITKAVILFGKEDKFGISNEQMINVAENMIQDSSMGVSRWTTDPATGIITIDAHNPKAEFEVLGLSDEVFTGGVTFRNSPLKGFEVMPYVNRQWCTNGLTTAMASEAYQLHSLDNKNMENFFESMQDLRRNNYAPEGFADRVRQANNTPASISEMEYAHNLISKHAGERTEQWVPLQENLNEYHKAGIESMTNSQKKMAKTNQSIWSVINGVTHFSSHGAGIIQTNMQPHNEADIQTRIGNLLGKKSFDHENTMPNPFSKEQLQQSGALLN
jgi:hypothetical protein|tara:strand:+ start:253 stop:1389 length:1137 start_codon:yes stop_codon:yes gene_type:complete